MRPKSQPTGACAALTQLQPAGKPSATLSSRRPERVPVVTAQGA